METIQSTPNPSPQPAASAGRTRVFLVDDHPIFRLGLHSLLESELEAVVIGESDDSTEAAGEIRRLTPDLVIADISLRGASGLDLIKSLRAENDATPVLVLSMHDERLFAERALRAGATGYLMKQTAPEGLVAGIRRALKGEMVLSDAMTSALLSRSVHRRPGTLASPVSTLSDRELEVFELLGRGYRTKEIAELLHISVKTVETHRAHIKEKLRLETAADLLRVATTWVLEGDHKKPD